MTQELVGSAQLQEIAHDRRRLLMDRSKKGRTGVSLPLSDVPAEPLPPTAA